MRPFFPFYGSKWNIARHYPAPTCGRVVEPFAGSAGYATFYGCENVTLIDADPVVAGVWAYLIRVTAAEILALPEMPEVGDSVDNYTLPQEAKWLIGFWLNRGSAQPKKSRTAYSARTDRAQLNWGARAKERIVSQLAGLSGWRVICASYSDAPTDRASFFVDPPYGDKGKFYRVPFRDFAALGLWCPRLDGQVIVCEGEGASWLPFEPLGSFKSSLGRASEVMWTNTLPLTLGLGRVIEMANDHVTLSLYQLMKLFPDQEAARVYLESRLWPHGPHCPTCGLMERITERKGGYYRCLHCKEDFTVRTGTIFERSHVPLHKWVMAMYLLVTARKGISSMQLSKELGITQKSAWFVLHRLREACGPDLEKLRGIIEIDETYVGGKEKNKHESKKLNAGRGTVGKTPLVVMRERGEGGRTLAFPVASVDTEHMHPAVWMNIEQGSTLHTDEAAVYAGFDGLYFKHESVNHKSGEYKRGNVTTNSAESFNAVFKRGHYGVYHRMSVKHLHRYGNEFAFRLNEGNVAIQTLDRLDSFIRKSSGKRLTYTALIAKAVRS